MEVRDGCLDALLPLFDKFITELEAAGPDSGGAAGGNPASEIMKALAGHLRGSESTTCMEEGLHLLREQQVAALSGQVSSSLHERIANFTSRWGNAEEASLHESEGRDVPFAGRSGGGPVDPALPSQAEVLLEAPRFIITDKKQTSRRKRRRGQTSETAYLVEFEGQGASQGEWHPASLIYKQPGGPEAIQSFEESRQLPEHDRTASVFEESDQSEDLDGIPDVGLRERGEGTEAAPVGPEPAGLTGVQATQHPWTQASIGSQIANADLTLLALGLQDENVSATTGATPPPLPNVLQPYMRPSAGSQNPDAVVKVPSSWPEAVIPTSVPSTISHVSDTPQPYTQENADSQNPLFGVDLRTWMGSQDQAAGGGPTPDGLSQLPLTHQALLVPGVGSGNSNPVLSPQPLTQYPQTQAIAESQNPVAAELLAKMLRPTHLRNGSAQTPESHERAAHGVAVRQEGRRDAVEFEEAGGAVAAVQPSSSTAVHQEAPEVAGGGVTLLAGQGVATCHIRPSVVLQSLRRDLQLSRDCQRGMFAGGSARTSAAAPPVAETIVAQPASAGTSPPWSAPLPMQVPVCRATLPPSSAAVAAGPHAVSRVPPAGAAVGARARGPLLGVPASGGRMPVIGLPREGALGVAGPPAAPRLVNGLPASLWEEPAPAVAPRGPVAELRVVSEGSRPSDLAAAKWAATHIPHGIAPRPSAVHAAGLHGAPAREPQPQSIPAASITRLPPLGVLAAPPMQRPAALHVPRDLSTPAPPAVHPPVRPVTDAATVHTLAAARPVPPAVVHPPVHHELQGAAASAPHMPSVPPALPAVVNPLATLHPAHPAPGPAAAPAGLLPAPSSMPFIPQPSMMGLPPARPLAGSAPVSGQTPVTNRQPDDRATNRQPFETEKAPPAPPPTRGSPVACSSGGVAAASWLAQKAFPHDQAASRARAEEIVRGRIPPANHDASHGHGRPAALSTTPGVQHEVANRDPRENPAAAARPGPRGAEPVLPGVVRGPAGESARVADVMEEAIDIIEDSEDSHEPEKDSSSDYEMHSDSNSESVSDPSDVNGDGGREVDGRNIMHPAVDMDTLHIHLPAQEPLAVPRIFDRNGVPWTPAGHPSYVGLGNIASQTRWRLLVKKGNHKLASHAETLALKRAGIIKDRSKRPLMATLGCVAAAARALEAPAAFLQQCHGQRAAVHVSVPNMPRQYADMHRVVNPVAEEPAVVPFVPKMPRPYADMQRVVAPVAEEPAVTDGNPQRVQEAVPQDMGEPRELEMPGHEAGHVDPEAAVGDMGVMIEDILSEEHWETVRIVGAREIEPGQWDLKLKSRDGHRIWVPKQDLQDRPHCKDKVIDYMFSRAEHTRRRNRQAEDQ